MVNNQGTKLLESQRLILRRFTSEDAHDIFNNWTSDQAVCQYLTWPVHANIDVTKTILNDWLANYSSQEFYQWAITLKSDNVPIGSISVVKFDHNLDSVEIGYCIGKAYWNKGFTTEALATLIKFFFDKVNVNRIEARHDSNNPASGQVMLKNNMKYEGTLRDGSRNNMGICNCEVYSILAQEYKFNK